MKCENCPNGTYSSNTGKKTHNLLKSSKYFSLSRQHTHKQNPFTLIGFEHTQTVTILAKHHGPLKLQFTKPLKNTAEFNGLQELLVLQSVPCALQGLIQHQLVIIKVIPAISRLNPVQIARSILYKLLLKCFYSEFTVAALNCSLCPSGTYVTGLGK